jgi:CRISPR-associated protein Cmr4
VTYQHALMFFQTVTPLHVGCGQDVGVVDLPVIRERTTGYPFIPGSGIRGALRDDFERRDREHTADDAPASAAAAKSSEIDLLFGPEARADGDEEKRWAGCVAVHDAKILLFPVRSDQRVFLWITCPAVLARFAKDLEVFLPAAGWPAPPIAAVGDEEVLWPALFAAPLYLEEFAFNLQGGAQEIVATQAALRCWLEKAGDALAMHDLADRAVLVADRTFHHYVTHATAVLQHNRLTSAKTVEGGALFAVEAVPPEAVFYGFLGGTTSRRPPADGERRLTPAEVLERLHMPWGAGTGPAHTYLHLGGDEGTGLGVTRLTWAATETPAVTGAGTGDAAPPLERRP